MFYSILIAVRNEVENLPFLFESLKNLEKNSQNFEILFGDDNSTDDSAELIANFTQENPQLSIFLYQITQNPYTKGKANVLAQLTRYAKGDIFLFTDADMEVSPSWVQSFEGYFTQNPRLGIITGITIPKIQGFFSAYQAIEWVFALWVIWFFGRFKIPLTAMGNNMAIGREAYFQTGGYEKIPFSVVEDYAIFWEIIKKKWHFLQLFSRENLSFTQPIASWQLLLHQRNRWMRGAMALGLGFRGLILLQFLAVHLLLFLGIFSGNSVFWWVLFGLIFGKWLLILGALFYLRKIKWAWGIPIYECCHFFFSVHLLLFYFFKKNVVWKERTF